ncbi:MAG: hypothetical protein ACJ8FY_29140 [Gemmataceae bacterium]
MATFYVLPPRSVVTSLLTNHLENALPGLPWTAHDVQQITELLSESLLARPDIYVVFREDLPAQDSAIQSLRDGFGAEPGDTIIEFTPGAKPGHFQTNQSRLAEAA